MRTSVPQEIVEMKKTSFPLSEVYRLLEPGPVVMLTSARGERANVMTMSWHTMVDFEPPVVACVISNRDYTFGIVKETRECAINIPTVELAKKVVGCGNTSGREVDKFKRFRLTALPAARVAAPLISECYASLECKVIDVSMADKYNLFILEVMEAWVDRSKKNPRTIHHCGRGVFMVAGRRIKLPSKMK
jgi:flavin reductase (DIM6/NTAB) family NADH-FMN oxidoreductase RutF